MIEGYEDIDLALARAAASVPDEPHRLAGTHRRRLRRLRQRQAGVAAGITAGLVLAGAVITVVHHPNQAASVTTAPPGGQLVGASGKVVAIPGRAVRFCDPFVIVNGWSTVLDVDCPGVDAEGVDVGGLTDRTDTAGTVRGEAHLVGTYTGGVLHVTAQGPPTSAPRTPTIHDHPPCAAPANGWATTPASGELDVAAAIAYQTAHPADVVQFALAHPSADQSLILILTNGNPAEAQRALARVYPPDQLCVAQSRYSADEIKEATRDPALVATMKTQIQSGNLVLNPTDDQVQYQIVGIIEWPAIAQAIRHHPDGLITFEAWLTPVP